MNLSNLDFKFTYVCIISGADTSLVEAAAIASRELEVEETGNKTDQTGSAPAPSAAAPSSGGQLEPALIHSDDGKWL